MTESLVFSSLLLLLLTADQCLNTDTVLKQDHNLALHMVNSSRTTQNVKNRPPAPDPRRSTLTENISSWIELVVFRFLLFFFFWKFIPLSFLNLGANIDLSIIVERLLTDPGRRRGDWFRDYIFDVLIVLLGPHWGVWDGCKQEEESEKTCGNTIMSRKYSILLGSWMRLRIVVIYFTAAALDLLHAGEA